MNLWKCTMKLLALIAWFLVSACMYVLHVRCTFWSTLYFMRGSKFQYKTFVTSNKHTKPSHFYTVLLSSPLNTNYNNIVYSTVPPYMYLNSFYICYGLYLLCSMISGIRASRLYTVYKFAIVISTGH